MQDPDKVLACIFEVSFYGTERRMTEQGVNLPENLEELKMMK